MRVRRARAAGGTAAAAGTACRIAVATALCAAPLGAQPAVAPTATPPAPPPAPTSAARPRLVPLVVPLTLDGRVLGEVAVDASLDGTVAEVDGARVADLLAPRIGGAAATALKAATAGTERVPVAALAAPGLRIRFDMAALTLKAEAEADALALRRVALAGIPAPDPAAFDPPAGLSAGVALTLFQTFGPVRSGDPWAARPLNGIVEGYARVGGFDGVALTYAAETLGSMRDVRVRDVALFHDRFAQAIRIGAGELTPRVGGFQTGTDLVGFGIERRYADIRPFQNIRSTGRRQIVLERPSEVEVFVNGVPVGQRRLAPGPYDLDQFPLTEGANNVQLIIRDPTGRREVIDFAVLSSATLLGEGVVDFGFWAGLPTAGNFETERQPAATGFVAAGVTSGLTLGAGVQAGRGTAVATALAAVGWRDTVLSVDLAHSRSVALDRSGQALGIDLRQTFSAVRPRDILLTASFDTIGRDFTSLGQPRLADREKWRLSAAGSWQLPQGFGMSLGGSWVEGRLDRPSFRSLTASAFAQVKRFTLNATWLYQDSGPEREHRAILGLTVPLGAGFTGSARTDLLRRERDLQLSRFLGNRLRDAGGTLQLAETPERRIAEGTVEYAGQRLGLELRHRLTDPRPAGAPVVNESRWRVSTFLGVADGLFGLGREATGGFMVVRRHPTLKDATLTVSNGARVVGRSDGLGNLLVPIERAYSDTRATLVAEPLPLGYDLGSGQIRLFPALGAGYDLTVGSDASLTVLGNFVTRAGAPLRLVSGELEQAGTGRRVPFFTNAAGRFAANRVAPGRYDVRLRDRVVGRIEVKAGDDSLVQLGRIMLETD